MYYHTKSYQMLVSTDVFWLRLHTSVKSEITESNIPFLDPAFPRSPEKVVFMPLALLRLFIRHCSYTLKAWGGHRFHFSQVLMVFKYTSTAAHASEALRHCVVSKPTRRHPSNRRPNCSDTENIPFTRRAASSFTCM